MTKYIEIRNDYELGHTINEFKKIGKLREFIAPKKVKDDGRVVVREIIMSPRSERIEVEAPYDLMQKLLDKINGAMQ